MRVVVLSSGSKGNCTYIECNGVKFLIDLGNTCKYVVCKLRDLDVDPLSLNGILISHTHRDHVGGLEVFLKKYNVPIYLSKGKLEELSYVKNFVLIDSSYFYIGDVRIDVIKTSHDAVESMGFVVSYGDNSVVQVTDTGYINHKYFDLLSNKDIYIFESNYDAEMLTNGMYPSHLKARVLSDKGHLSNYDCSRYLSSFVGDKTKYIILAHLSSNNNTRDIALSTLRERFFNENKNVDNIYALNQLEMSEIIEL